MTDLYKYHTPSAQTPARRAQAVTLSDSAPLTPYAKALWIGGDGDVTVTTADEDVVTFKGARAGTYLLVQCSKVHATGTTATDIVALS